MSEKIKVNRNYQDVFVAFLEELGLSSFGCSMSTGAGLFNEVFEVHPYKETYICTCDQNTGDCQKHKPNFYFKPDQVKIWWYKYPLREAMSTHQLTDEKLEQIFKKCLESVGRG
jgi:hypothetical protein